MKTRKYLLIYLLLIVTSLLFLFIHKLTHIEFTLHLAAIPIEVLVAVFIVERFLEIRETKEKRKQLMYIKSCMFRSDMRELFITNFNNLKYPAITMLEIKDSNLDDLKKIRKEAERVEYKSLEMMEPVIMEYVKAQSVWQNFMDIAISYNFEEIFHDMIYILHFIHDVKIFKDSNPDKLFIYEAEKKDLIMQKVMIVLGDGIRKFLDYAIELKEKQPEMFDVIISDYEVSTLTEHQ